MKTYVLSDIHGNERRFRSVMKQIDLQPEDTLYILGDVVDRHPWGIRLLQEIMAMPNAQMLLGNHEYMMLQALGHPHVADTTIGQVDPDRALALWYHNGGRVTHSTFQLLSESEQEIILQYLKNLPLNLDVEVQGRMFKLVHGAPVEMFTPSKRYPDATLFAVWKRLDPQDIRSWEYTLIFGHTPTPHYQYTNPTQLWYGRYGIGIDCGCGYPDEPYDGIIGRLACLRLEDGAVFYSEEKEAHDGASSSG